MKKVIVTAPAKMALRTLAGHNRRRITTWFKRLANLDGEGLVLSHSRHLDAIPGVYVLKASAAFRVFFRIEEDTLAILDIAKKQSILMSGPRGSTASVPHGSCVSPMRKELPS
jgi:mRNA-degrading endonuclease RelE of RelBE toxin-antitoxin system